MDKLLTYFRFVKIEHSIFALPFAYIGLFLASKGSFPFKEFLLVSLAMVSVRSFAMGMNRILDLPFDKKNPRTKDRPLVKGEITVKEALLFVLCCAFLFVFFCWLLNPVCFKFSFFALFWAGFYSLTKRFTSLSHFWLGSVLGMAPVGGWLAYDPHFSLTQVLLFLGVMFWVAGFDIIYATLDVEFDKKMGLFSLPKEIGIECALHISLFCHINASILFFLAGISASLGVFYFLTAFLVFVILLLEHKIISPDDLSKVNLAFFTFNGFVSVILFLGVIGDLLK